jgi:hypothetical protein
VEGQQAQHDAFGLAGLCRLAGQPHNQDFCRDSKTWIRAPIFPKVPLSPDRKN